MAEKSKQAYDPDATVAQPLARTDDPEATDRRPAFDPEATVNPAERATLDPEATVRIPGSVKIRLNPFAPKSPPETLQANLATLGGVNPLVAMANPILAAVPQIRRALKHPDPAGLQANLKDQIESLEMSAVSAEIPDDTVSAAVYALCALLDESAAATPWGREWQEKGLLQAMRGETGGAEGFFAQLERVAAEPEKNADLLEFLYVCLALGFEGRYRAAADGRQQLDQVKDRLYQLIARRKPRPDALSERWRTPAAQAAADAALKTAARANAAREAAEAAARSAAAAADEPAGFALSRLPRRVIWSAVGGIVGATLVFYMLALRLQEDETRAAMSPTKLKDRTTVSADATAPAPAASAAASVAKALEGLPVAVAGEPGPLTVTLRHEHQFHSGSSLPVPEVRLLVQKIAAALDPLPVAILVVGHADATPAGAHHASNAELSSARARAVARAMALKMSDPKRVTAEGRGEAEPLAPNDSDANRAKNRRVSIVLKPAQ